MALEKFNHQIHPSVRIGEDEGLAGLPVVPFGTILLRERHIEDVFPALILHMDGESLRQSVEEGGIADGAFPGDAQHPHAAVLIVEHIRAVCCQDTVFIYGRYSPG
ncbi:MAG: hypothetical protein J5990_08990 [Bacteroidales bacterium]|nr:hypothetical protein [Bacteroidales bacterium]